jgi:hypothetical protein
MMATFDGGKYLMEELPPVTKVPIEEILEQHRYRYVLETSKGTVVMKHISKRMKQHIDRIRYTRYPQAYMLEQEADIVYPLYVAGNKEENVVKRAEEIASQLAPTLDLYALGIIEFPFLTTPEDLEGFLDALTADEREAIRQMLTVLTAWNRPVDFSQLEIAERFHLQMIREEHIKDPTYQQYRALYAVIEQEHEAMSRLYEGVKG